MIILKDEEIEAIEKLINFRDNLIDRRYKRRFYEIKTQLLIISIGLGLAWIIIFLILLGVL